MPIQLKHWSLVVAAAVLLALAPCAVSAEPVTSAAVKFQIGHVQFSMVVPKGFCNSSTDDNDAFKPLTNIEPKLLFLAGVSACERPGEFFTIMTNRDTVNVDVDRETLLGVLSADAVGPETVRSLSSPEKMEELSNQLSKNLNKRTDVAGALAPLGRDDVCFYLGGVMKVSTKQGGYFSTTAACITAVGGRLVMITRYLNNGSPGSVITLLAEARALAQSIQLAPTTR